MSRALPARVVSPPERGASPIRVLRLLAGISSCVAMSLWLVTATCRASYPYDIEWQEGGVAQHANRVLLGEPLYPPPSLDFTPYIYPPFYFWTSAQVMRVVGVSLLAARLVSIAATIGTFVGLALFVRRVTGDGIAGVIAAGLYASTFVVCGGWFDLARVDSLFLLLCVVALHPLVPMTCPGALLSGVLFALAFLTKQSALTIAIPVGCAVAMSGVRPLLFFLGGFGPLAATVTAMAAAATDRYYLYYVFRVPAGHDMDLDPRSFILQDLGAQTPVLLALSLLFVVRPTRSVGKRIAMGFLVGAFVTSGAARMHSAGTTNNLMPVMAALAMATALWLAHLGSAGSVAGNGMALLLVLSHFVLHAYDVRPHLPTRADREAGDALVALLAKEPGDVLVPDHGFLAVQAGKAPSAQYMAIWDIQRSRARPPKPPRGITREIDTALRHRRFSLAVIGRFDRIWRVAMVDSYREAGPVFDDPGVFWTREGTRVRPMTLFRPRERGRRHRRGRGHTPIVEARHAWVDAVGRREEATWIPRTRAVPARRQVRRIDHAAGSRPAPARSSSATVRLVPRSTERLLRRTSESGH